jgi:hypothetical protein
MYDWELVQQRDGEEGGRRTAEEGAMDYAAPAAEEYEDDNAGVPSAGAGYSRTNTVATTK